MKIHSSITKERLIDAWNEVTCGTENIGFCVSCGADHYDCEQDAFIGDIECEDCGEARVVGTGNLLLCDLRPE